MGLRAAEDTGSRFVAFVDGLVSVIGHADRAGPLRDCCTGLVMPCERKSVEPMAAVTAPANVGAQHQSLLHARVISLTESEKTETEKMDRMAVGKQLIL